MLHHPDSNIIVLATHPHMDRSKEMAEAKGKEKEREKDFTRSEPKYEVYVRLPFNRGDFVDPPPVDWDGSKSDALWNIISDVELTKSKIDWNELADSFGVGVDFLLMMAQTLAERHANQLMGLFRKAAAFTGSGGAPSPVTAGFPPDTASEAMKRTASGSGARPSSPASMRRDSPLPRADGSTHGTPLKSSLALRPPITSRNSTSNTTVLTQNLVAAICQTPSPGPSKPAPSSSSARPTSPLFPRHHRPSKLQVSTAGIPPQHHHHPSPSPSPTSPAKSSTGSSSSSSSPVESRIIKRPPRFQSTQDRSAPGAGSLFGAPSDPSDDDAEPAFLPYRSPAPDSAGASSDLASTLRGRDERVPATTTTRHGLKVAAAAFLSSPSASTAEEKMGQSHTSDESADSVAMGGSRTGGAGLGDGRRTERQMQKQPAAGPLSPRRTAELAGRSPGLVRERSSRGREGSDGTPSMGSSFSDLDDASVTQSALEEALASKMQDGGATIGSRMSTFGQAIKSRYLPKGGGTPQP